jgi:hypothetical protein
MLKRVQVGTRVWLASAESVLFDRGAIGAVARARAAIPGRI